MALTGGGTEGGFWVGGWRGVPVDPTCRIGTAGGCTCARVAGWQMRGGSHVWGWKRGFCEAGGGGGRGGKCGACPRGLGTCQRGGGGVDSEARCGGRKHGGGAENGRRRGPISRAPKWTRSACAVPPERVDSSTPPLALATSPNGWRTSRILPFSASPPPEHPGTPLHKPRPSRHPSPAAPVLRLAHRVPSPPSPDRTPFPRISNAQHHGFLRGRHRPARRL